MKKVISVILILLMSFLLGGCGENPKLTEAKKNLAEASKTVSDIENRYNIRGRKWYDRSLTRGGGSVVEIVVNASDIKSDKDGYQLTGYMDGQTFFARKIGELRIFSVDGRDVRMNTAINDTFTRIVSDKNLYDITKKLKELLKMRVMRLQLEEGTGKKYTDISSEKFYDYWNNKSYIYWHYYEKLSDIREQINNVKNDKEKVASLIKQYNEIKDKEWKEGQEKLIEAEKTRKNLLDNPYVGFVMIYKGGMGSMDDADKTIYGLPENIKYYSNPAIYCKHLFKPTIECNISKEKDEKFRKEVQQANTNLVENESRIFVLGKFKDFEIDFYDEKFSEENGLEKIRKEIWWSQQEIDPEKCKNINEKDCESIPISEVVEQRKVSPRIEIHDIWLVNK